jgi:hypothetical protein
MYRFSSPVKHLNSSWLGKGCLTEMGARRLPRPPSKRIGSALEVLDWLEFLCLNSDCRGLGGYELVDSTELLGLTVLSGDTPYAKAECLRQILKHLFTPDSDSSLATLHLLGLTPSSTRQPRPNRRRLAAEAYGQAINTFQKHYELPLLRDAAEAIWGLALEGHSLSA